MTHTTISRALLGLTALAFAGIALWTLVDPVGAIGQVGLAPTDARGTVELRAMYGGLQAGAAVFLVACAVRREWIAPGLAASAAMVGGLGLVRAAGLALQQPDGWLMYGFAVLEVTGAALCAAALAAGPRDR